MVAVEFQQYPLNPTLRWTTADGRLTSEGFRMMRAISAIVSNVLISSQEITTEMLADLAVTADKVGNEAIIAAKIAAGAILADKIAANAVTAAAIAAASITTEKIAADAVTADKILVNELAAISAVLGNVQVNGNLLVNGTITAGKYGLLSVPTGAVQNNAITIFSGTNPGAKNAFSTTETTIQTHPVTSDGGAVLLMVSANVGWTTPGGSNWGPTTWRIRKNGSQVSVRNIVVDDSWSGLQSWFWIDPSPGTSPNTYTLTTQASDVGPTYTHFTDQAVIIAFGGKK